MRGVISPPATAAAPAAEPLVRFQRPEPPPLEEVAGYYRMAEEAGFYANGGPCATLLERRLADHLGGGVRCVTAASGTAGLLVALRAAFGGPDRRRVVLTPAFTFVATACVIEWAGFRPLFVDIEPGSWQMDPRGVERALARAGGAVAGVLGCSTFGTVAPAWIREAWRDACARHGVPLILDSAAAFGSVDEAAAPAGALGEVEVFSFHATKPFAVGEGGMVAAPDEETAERIRRLANFGLAPETRVAHGVGLNAKMPELAAATGLAMLDRYPGALAERRATAAILREALDGLPLAFQRGAEGSTFQILQVVLPDAARRDAALRAAGELGVQARHYFDPPLHRHPAFAAAPREGDLRVTDAIAARSLSLPMANRLAPEAIDRIVAAARRALGPAARGGGPNGRPVDGQLANSATAK
jgi:dTDP-4-amino-4,6-dideoxygalactose transaminase